jgi:hypothetical protein
MVTTTVLGIAPVERRSVGDLRFVRFIGGGLGHQVAATLVEHLDVQVPFLIGTRSSSPLLSCSRQFVGI